MRGAGRFKQKTLGIGFFALAGLLPSLSWAAAEAGKIVLVKGDVFILDAKDKSVVADPLGKRGRSTQKGSAFFEGETIQTKDGARVKLLFNEGGNEVVLGSSTSLVVERAGGAAKSGTSLDLKQGTVRSSVNKKYSGEGDDVFEVKTPNSVAGVRGTVFNVAYDNKKNMTQVLTERGSVAVKSLTAAPNAKPIIVNAGMFSEVKKGDAPSAAQAAPAQMIESISPENEKSGSESSSNDSDSNESGATEAPANEASQKESAPKESTQTESPKNDTTRSESSSGSSEAPKSASTGGGTQDAKKADGPAVALAPQPANSTSSSSGSRSPANAGPEPVAAPKIISSGGAAQGPPVVRAANPIDIINRSGDSLRKAAENQMSQQRLTDGNMSEIKFKVE